MDINIINQIGTCEIYQDDKGKRDTVTVVISPLSVVSDGKSDSIRISNGCNMWVTCCNKKCFFSAAARHQPRIQRKEG